MAGRYTASSFAGSLGVAVVTWYGQRWRELFRGKRKFEFRRPCCLWFLDLAPTPLHAVPLKGYGKCKQLLPYLTTLLFTQVILPHK